MQRIATVDTTEQQAFVWPIGVVDIPTLGASLRGVVGIDAYHHTAMQDGFIGKHPVKLGKGPLRIHAVATTLLHRNTLGTSFRLVDAKRLPLRLPGRSQEREFRWQSEYGVRRESVVTRRIRSFSLAILLALVGAPFGALSNMGQLFYSDEGMGMISENTPGNGVVGVCFQPSLSSTDRNQATCRGTSAFFLQTFAQPGVMVGSVSDLLARMEGGFSFVIGRDGKIANAHINTNDLRVLIWRWIWPLNLKRNEQEVSFVWLVIPELCGANFSLFFQELEMFIISLVRDHDSAIERQETDLLIDFERIVFPILIGQGRRNKRRRLIETFIALLCVACFACSGVLFGFGPASFIGGGNLTHHATGHLRRQVEESTNIGVGAFVQAKIATDLAMLKRIATDNVERITIRQLRCAQDCELLRRRVQFEFGGQCLFHIQSIAE